MDPVQQVPNWEAFLSEPFWQDHVRPLLEQLREQALDLLLDPAKSGGIEQVRFLQGKAAAYHELLTEPERQIALQRIFKAQEQQQSDEENYGSRRAARTRW